MKDADKREERAGKLLALTESPDENEATRAAVMLAEHIIRYNLWIVHPSNVSKSSSNSTSRKSTRSTSPNNQGVTIVYDSIEHETAKAWLIVIGLAEYWIPKSQGELVDGSNEMIIPAWLAIEKGLA